jgi:phosphohistidine phosphatase
MDLILWRHADAEDGADDLRRQLTAKGREQAARVAQWLLQHLPGDFEVVASPAARAQQTAEALTRKFKTEKQLAPGAPVHAILKAAGWPGNKSDRTVVVVGHQPDLGRAAAHLLAGKQADWRIKKGGLWWLSNKNNGELIVRAVVSPDLL